MKSLNLVAKNTRYMFDVMMYKHFNQDMQVAKNPGI